MITDEEFTNFVNENKVGKGTLKGIAANIMCGKTLTDRELSIYEEWANDIEKIIKDE